MLAALEHAESSLGLGLALDEVLFPVMRLIGTWWLREPFETDTERLATEVARRWLETVSAAAPSPAEVAPVVLACGPGDRHTMGQEALAALLRLHRQPVRLLSARTVSWMIPNAVRASGADAVVVVSHLYAHHLAATQSLVAAHAMGVDVFYAGEAFASERERRDIPGRYLGASLIAASTMILTRATSGRARRPTS
ncbi:MAG: hypothetical protein M3O28_05120 [Actinomycetota bacterium]|nr:hypothetical protein [Actinomycetota bacterium]